MTTAKLSLCMIVKDEAEMLPGFLKAAQGLYDELCVVDTGSSDSTMDILREAGARLQEQPWRDNFAAARNASLDMATGDWILFLDADERISAPLIKEIRATINNDELGAATLIMRNPLPNGSFRESPLLRLFRRHPSIRFRYPIHEDLSESLDAFLKQHKLKAVALSGVVEHLGYSHQRAQAKEKKARDLALLRRCLENQEDDFYAWFKILELARFWRDQGLWRRSAQEVNALLPRLPQSPFAQSPYAGNLVALVAQAIHHNPQDELAFLEPFVSQLMPNPALTYRLGELYEQSGQLAKAQAQYERCMAFPPVRELQLVGLRPLLGLSRLAIARGELTQARRLNQQALDEYPRDPEALLAGVGLAAAMKKKAGIKAFTAQYLRQHGAHRSLYLALAEYAIAGARWIQARRHLERALELGAPAKSDLQLAKVLLAMGELRACRQKLDGLVSTRPEAALGLLVCDLIEQRSSDLEIDLEQDEADRALRSWVEFLLRGGKAENIAFFVTLAEAIYPYFPWLEEFLAPLIER